MPNRPALRRAALAAAVGAALALASLSAAAAGRVEVRFVEPARYTDAGFGAREIERTTAQLGAALRSLGARLPDGQTLTLEILDVDLAGRTVPGSARDTRVLTGGADWPRITLRWTLAGAGEPRSGEETVSNLDYLEQRIGGSTGEPLEHERRMLERWFERRFVAP